MGFLQTVGVAAITAFLTYIGYGVATSLQRSAEKDKALEAEKREAYKNLLSLLFGVLKSVKIGGPESVEKEIGEKFFELTRDLTVYASDEVLRLFIRFKRQQQPADPLEVITLFGDIIVAVRKDLGHSKTSITRNDVLSTFITDIETLELPACTDVAPMGLIAKVKARFSQHNNGGTTD